MPEFFSTGWLEVGAPVANSLLCLAAVFGILRLMRLNKGAKVNYAWSLIALGLLALGAAEGDRVLEVFGLPNLSDLREIIRVCGALLILCGVTVVRDLLRRLVR
jgi:hypothetical protein